MLCAKIRNMYYNQLCIFCRGTRESTPCSLIRVADTITTPGSTTKQTCSGAASQSALLINAPSSRELEEFFACEEQSMQRHFMEKYGVLTLFLTLFFNVKKFIFLNYI